MSADTRSLTASGTELERSFPILGHGETYDTITSQIADVPLKDPIRKGWVLGLLISFAGVNLFLCSVVYLIAVGVGIWGINVPVAWGFAIINFVWWIGIGHAGTLISAVLLLLKQRWRTSINRFAEAMTIFAVVCAGMFPLLHIGRHVLFYWLLPYPSSMGVWPQFRSPLVWDVFAVSTYANVSLVYWYIGLVPDFASLRDRSPGVGKYIYGLLALGWRSSARHWERYEMAYLLLGGLATPLVLSVHSIVSFDFSVAQLPGWHTTIFPPYFVAGAIYAGFAMVLTLVIPVRKIYNMKSFITMRHINNMAKVMLATGIMVAYGYFIEAFTGWYSGNKYEHFTMYNRLTGPYAPAYWALLLCNVVVPQILWLRKYRFNTVAVWIVAMFVNVGMWLERFIIVVTSLHRDFMPSSWDMYYPTVWDWATYIGTIGLFMTLIFLFIRFMPMISIAEIKAMAAEEKHHSH